MSYSRFESLIVQPQLSADDVFIWPCGTWCYRYELSEFSHKSDDFRLVKHLSPEWFEITWKGSDNFYSS